MPFTEKQTKLLEQKLEPANVKQRSNGSFKLDYIEGWHAISEANRIFGFDGWDRQTELAKLGEPEEVNRKWRVRFMATVTILVRAGDQYVTRQGIGYGDGIAGDLGAAFEGAIKEAETDATKRALSTFGNQFGLALYDKDKANVGKNDVDPEKWGEAAADAISNHMKAPTPTQAAIYTDLMDEVMAADSPDALDIWVDQEPTKKLAAKLTDQQKQSLWAEIKHKKQQPGFAA